MEEIVTGEAVVLDLPCARFPARILSRIIDMAVELVLFFIVAVLVGYFLAGEALSARTVVGTLLVLVSVLVITTTPAKKSAAPAPLKSAAETAAD